MRILLVMDSFKGSLTSVEAEAAVAEGLRAVFPDCELCCVPASDGGEGMMEAFVAYAGGRYVSVQFHDPRMRLREAKYGIVEHDSRRGQRQEGRGIVGNSRLMRQLQTQGSVEGMTAVIEIAQAAGLELLSPSERNPMLTSTYGVGEMIASALADGCRSFIVGIGGSATNDAGLGMMEALGARFYATDGSALSPCGGNLSQIARIDLASLLPELSSSSFVVACDVRNVFYGSEGAARVYAPQKGASPQQVEILDAGMKHVASLIQSMVGLDLFSVPGSGAAGGLGGAFLAFLGASLRPGVEVFTEFSDLEEKIVVSDLIITGEGKADKQTLMGKLPFGILQAASSLGSSSHDSEQSGSGNGRRRVPPVVLVAGLVEEGDALLEAGFAALIQSAPTSQFLSEAMLPSIASRNLTAAICENDKILRELLK